MFLQVLPVTSGEGWKCRGLFNWRTCPCGANARPGHGAMRRDEALAHAAQLNNYAKHRPVPVRRRCGTARRAGVPVRVEPHLCRLQLRVAIPDSGTR